ncbi:MAG: histidine kinase N-terminal domain-containing protein, partial [Candidatus Sericytochromatia bacterium]|nr:histidine kinase N-terminal domain-containing protein [Candidatus Sericytochromatia bacterium]
MLAIGALQSLPDRNDIKNVYIPDEVILNTIGNSIVSLSDFIPADIHLYKLVDNNILKTIAEAKPSIYPSFYRRLHLEHTFLLKEDSLFYTALKNQEKTDSLNNGQIFNGLPLFQTIYPIINKNNKTIGFLLVERSLYEQRRWGLKEWLYQNTVNNIIQAILESSFLETRALPIIYPGDGIVILDSNGIINYSNYTAINTAKYLELITPLEGNSFEEVFSKGTWRILEVNSLYSEQELTVDSYVINIKVIPLDSIVLIVLRDVSELRHKDQEIKVKSAIIKEIHHRVKNNLQSIASLLRLQQRRTQNMEVKDILSDSINRINSISVVHDYLSQKNVDVIDLTEMAKNILFEVSKSFTLPDKKIGFNIYAPDNLLFPSAKAVS